MSQQVGEIERLDAGIVGESVTPFSVDANSANALADGRLVPASVRDSSYRCRRLIFGTIEVPLRLPVDLGEVCIRLSVVDWL